jgi:hypothetical protein
MTKPTEEEINKVIHEWMGLCWHENVKWTHNGFNCSKCNKPSTYSKVFINPNYCSDDSPRKLLNDVLEKIEAMGKYDNMLSILIYENWDRENKDFGSRVYSAEQIARAIAEVIESE